MSRGFAHPYLLVALLVIIGAGVTVFAGSRNLAGLVLGTKSRTENIYQYRTDGYKVTVVSPKLSWDLTQYLCTSRDECEKSPTSGKWWATVSGASTTMDGHEVIIERSDGWSNYSFLKLVAKEAGWDGVYIKPQDSQNTYLIIDLLNNSQLQEGFVFK